MPDRIQLSRAKGWRMPPNTIKVDRTTKWGNPFSVESLPAHARTPADAFDPWIRSAAGATIAQQARVALRGKNLACWCKIGAACHADVLLRIANAPEPPSRD